MIPLKFDTTTIEVWPQSTRILFEDGTVVLGAPEDTDQYRATAFNHGYGEDTLQLCKDHELMHVALTDWLGIESPTMKLVRFGHDDKLVGLSGLEEDAVLAIQRFARAAGIDLIQRMKELQRDTIGSDAAIGCNEFTD